MNIILNAAAGVNDCSYRSLCIFKNSQRLHAANDEARDTLTAFNGTYIASRGEWKFPSGATIRLGVSDPGQYRGMVFQDVELDAGVNEHPIYDLIKRRR